MPPESVTMAPLRSGTARAERRYLFDTLRRARYTRGAWHVTLQPDWHLKTRENNDLGRGLGVFDGEWKML
jgi:hypothetical protein